MLDRRPAKAATALPSSRQPGPLPGEPPTIAPSERLFWILGAVVALVTLAVFLPSVRNGWVNWEDADNFLALAALTVPQIGIWKDSVTLWERAAETEPQSDIPIFYLGWALTEAGRFDEAQAHFERSLVRVPPDLPALRAQFLFHLGIVEQRRGRPANAEARFREALRLDPQHPAGWIRLGVILWARGQREEATRAWAEAVSLAPRWGAYHLWEIRLAASEVPEVAAVARGRLAFRLGALLEQYRQPSQALEPYRVAAALLPDDLTACGRAKRLSAAVAPGEAVACAPRGRP